MFTAPPAHAAASTQQMEQTYRVNIFALFWLCKAALLPCLRGIDHQIINTA